jgi:hypothetical protein
MPVLPVDPLLSYARRIGGAIKIVLVVGPTEEPIAAEVDLRLRDGEAIDVPTIVATLEKQQTRVEALVPEGRLRDGTWKLKLVDAATKERRNLRTRLLVRSGMPIALLTGTAPETRLPEPLPR